MATQERHSYVQFYASDWMAGTSFMPASAEWLYLQICLYNWDKREALPQAQMRLRFSRSPTWESDLQMLVEAGKVHVTHAGALFVERAMREAEKAFGLWEAKSRGGRSKKRTVIATDTQDTCNTDGNSLASNENENENENDTTANAVDHARTRADASAGDLLFHVPRESLSAFREHRAKLRKPMTDKAEQLLIRKLQKLHEQHGHDPTAMLEQSIENGWQGVFALKDEGHANGTANRRNTAANYGQRDNRDGFTRALDQHFDVR